MDTAAFHCLILDVYPTKLLTGCPSVAFTSPHPRHQTALCELVGSLAEIPIRAFPPVAQTVKNLPAMQETPVQSLGWEDPLEKETKTRSSILAWRIPWTEEPGGLQSMGSQRVRHNSATNTVRGDKELGG